MEIRDQLGRKIHLSKVPERIVSLVPSQTELLVDLGMEKNIVGITQFCVHPSYLKKIKTRVGGTKKVNFRKIHELEPDLILCNKEENTPEMVSELEKIATVHISDVVTIEDAFDLMLQYGKMFDRENFAQTMIGAIRKKLDNLRDSLKDKPVKKVAYFIWKAPYMLAGQNTFINSLLEINNFENAVKENRYPQMSLKEIKNLEPELCLLSSEPYSFTEEHKKELQPHFSEVKLVDGEYFSWYGSRLSEALDYFKALHLNR
ncbi:cobalamin-binding protein [Christiangramia fulva]|uniref:Cobalamin-binding protein n=1 Tax=Christiangramia fulva TaxID=2126553 RepID=A0A2R3Z5Z0_9FLAO|nr:helical backbone metal receptor [Christiangramia fulva]AVR45680.1 cobalamin-binding protein [Christiangramia fulva]